MGIYDKRVCHCGSGKSSIWQLDGNGIPLCRTCAECHERKMSGYRAEVLVPYGQDVVDEPIEPDDYWFTAYGDKSVPMTCHQLLPIWTYC